MTDERERTSFPKLNETNWAFWSTMMEAELIRRKLWSSVDVVVNSSKGDGTMKNTKEIKTEMDEKLSARTSDNMEAARAEILIRLEQSQISHVMGTRDPRVMWKTLENVH